MEKNWLEWVVFGSSLLLILGTAGLLVRQHLSLGKRPPDPQVILGEAEPHEGYFALPIAVVNRGDSTAESVQVEVTLQIPGKESETGEVQLQYLPREATRHAWVTFRHDPRLGKLQPRVLGYQTP